MKRTFQGFSLKRLLVRLAIWSVLSLSVLYALLVWWCTNELAKPARRPVQAGAMAYVDGAAKAGFQVENFTSSDGMPCAVCTPEKTASFSQRAATVRQQLADRGLDLGEAGNILGTLVILHGRGGNKEDYFPVAERFCAAGLRCVIPDLPGHGSNQGRFTTYGVLEAEMVLKCYQEAAQRYHFEEQPCVILGQSMGGSVAIHTAALKESPFASMVVVSSFGHLENVVREKAEGLLGPILGAAVGSPIDILFGWKTGVNISEIRPMDKAATIQIPTMVVHGDSDKFVPTASGMALFESFPDGTEKQWVAVPTADHNSVLVTDFPLYATMAEWFIKHLRN